MTTIKRGNTWWYEFQFQGVRIRESSHRKVRAIAERLERERRRKLELGTGGLTDTKGPRLFSLEAKKWLQVNEASWSASNRRIEGYNIDHLSPHFGKKMLPEITADDIARYQGARRKEGAGPRTINMEVGSLRAILRNARLWANLQPDVKMLKTREDIGRAISEDEKHRLLTACKRSRSRSLYPAFLLSLHTGLRNGELPNLQWHQIDLIERTVTVGNSKTKGGEGRLVPLSNTAFECIQEWRRKFPEAQPSHYVFAREKYGLKGEDGYKTGVAVAYDIDPTKPITSWKVAWTNARKVAKVECRWHDSRHSFISILAERHASDTTIMALAGHVSKKMMERYSHTRNERKREAISIFDKAPSQAPTPTPQPKAEKAAKKVRSQKTYYQNPPHSKTGVIAPMM